MATESPKQRSDEATLTSATEPTVKTDTDSQDVPLDRPHVNGDANSPAPAPTPDEFENKHISDIVDDLVNSAEVSISGGSDNEAARSDASKTRDDAKGLSRSSSAVKKPASFKAIKVNKTFLTSKAAASGTQAKTNEKAPQPASASPAPTGVPSTTRPRLVAKTGSGLVTKSSAGNVGRPSAAPDASAVWNKNRPTPPPEPKKYTDEELKKYGIHMASRLQPDDSKGQSNWADIEDDDDDWAPDTITWKDGTKIAITQPEEHPPPPPQPDLAPVAKDNEPPEKPKSPAPGTSPSVKPSVLGSGKGLVLKGAPEKPTLVAKPPPPPAPTKSPWAPLPKIDKVSPVAADVSTQAGPKFTPRDMAAHKMSAPPPPPPKEIAADDFSRAPWRDGPAPANRELFNSHSGRYEPVLDRRAPMRPEPPQARQPALLQRAPQHEPQHPPEPSGAPQLGRNNDQAGPYGRRRTSSNVSGGSGSWQRLKGPEHPLPPPEFINARRASMTGGSDSPTSPRNFSPSGLQGGPRPGQPWPPRGSPSAVHTVPYQPGAQAPDGRAMAPPAQAPATVPVTEEDYELQKRLMRERRELAMRRRQEEEAREEAARRERIRLKLEALGPAPESKSAKKAAAAKEQTKEQVAAPTQIQTRESTESQQPGSVESQASDKDGQAAAGVPEPAKQEPPSHPNGAPAQPLAQPEGVESRPHPRGTGHAQPWAAAAKPSDRDPATTWGPQPSTKNVWGAPNNNRSLGNGTFVTDIGASQLPQLPGKSAPGPGPIAPPASARTAAAQQASIPPAGPRQQPPIGPPRRAQASRGSGERDGNDDNPWAAAVRLNDEKFSEMLSAQYEERERRLQAEGRSLSDIQPAIRDTWRPTKLDENGVRTEAAQKQTLQIGQENPWASPAESKTAGQPQAAPPVSGSAPPEYGHLAQSTVPARDMTAASMLGAKAAAAQQARGSRFFPSRDARQEAGRDARADAATEATRHKSPSPPPPDMAGHPAFDGDATHPHVSLPRPQPVVRLPPSAAKDLQSSAQDASRGSVGPSRPQAPSFAWAAQAAYKDQENAPRAPGHKPENAWQAKIDNLLGGRKVHGPSRTQGADGGQRGAQQQHPDNLYPVPGPCEAGGFTTREMAEACFEEQEMGSLPLIRFPKTIPEMAWQPAPPTKALPKALYPAVTSADPVSFPVDVSGAGTVWRICLPGNESKSITFPFGRTRSNPRRGGPRSGRHAAGQHRQGKGREAPASYPTEQGGSGSGAKAAQGRSNRGGGYRGRENWSRNSTAQTQS